MVNRMTKQDFLTEIEIVLEADAGTITGEEVLIDLAGWDSLAVLTFIAMVDEKFGITLAASKIAESSTIEDLIRLLGDKILN